MSRRPRRGRIGGRRAPAACWLVILAALALGTAEAGAAWTAPVNLSARGDPAWQAQAAIDPAGDAAFAWQLAGAEGVAQARARTWPGDLSPIQDVSPFGGEPYEVSFEPQVAVSDSGDAVLAWARYTQAGGSLPRVQARGRSASGVLGPVRNLSPRLDDVEDVGVDVDADGDAVFVWAADLGGHHQVQARTLSAAGVLGPPLELTQPGQDATRPRVVVDADGDALFVWQRLDGASFRAETRSLSAAGILGPPETLSSSRWSSTGPQVAAAPHGDAVYVWRSVHPQGLGSARIETRARVGGVLTRRQTVADAVGDATDPTVGIADDGAALLAWRRANGRAEWLRLRPRSALGGLGDTRSALRVEAPQALSGPRLAVDADGDAVLAWELFDASQAAPACCALAQARTRSALGAFGPIATLSGPGRSATGLELAGAPSGATVATWTRSNGGPGRVQVVAGP